MSRRRGADGSVRSLSSSARPVHNGSEAIGGLATLLVETLGRQAMARLTRLVLVIELRPVEAPRLGPTDVRDFSLPLSSPLCPSSPSTFLTTARRSSPHLALRCVCVCSTCRARETRHAARRRPGPSSHPATCRAERPLQAPPGACGGVVLAERKHDAKDTHTHT